MRVAQVVPMFSNRFGGPVTMVADAAEVLAGLGVQAQIYATDLGKAPWAKDWRSVLPEELPANADVLDYELFPVKAPHRLLYSPGLAKRLDEVVKDFDLVHIHSLWLHPQYAAQHAARKAGVPYVVSLHGALDPYLRQRGKLRKAVTSKLWQDGMLENAKLLHVTTQAEQELTDDIAPNVPRVHRRQRNLGRSAGARRRRRRALPRASSWTASTARWRSFSGGSTSRRASSC